MPGAQGAEGTGRWVAARRLLALREIRRAGAETEAGTGTGVGTAGAAATKIAQIATRRARKVPRALQQRLRERAAKEMLRLVTVRRPSRPADGCMCPAEGVLVLFLSLALWLSSSLVDPVLSPQQAYW